ncbi:MAG: glycerate kinase type-2 family protein [Thermodesulfobacteriota bacterium]
MGDTRKAMESILRAGLDAADPEQAVKRYVRRDQDALVVGERSYDLKRYQKVVIIGAGKGTAPMAKALEDILGDVLTGGWIVVKYGYGMPLRRTHVAEAGHPIPDEAGLSAAEELLRRIEGCTEKDLVICAFSGGGSALLPVPIPPFTLEDKQACTQALMECGASIDEINAIRKHLSRTKGGQLAREAYPAAMISLLLSDVVGDRLDVIASGPTVPDDSTYRECVEIVERYDLSTRLPKGVVEHFKKGIAGDVQETPKQGDPVFSKVQNLIVGNNRDCLLAARDKAAYLGYHTLVLTSQIEGEAREAAQVVASIGKEVRQAGIPIASPACILAGGETTVTIHGKGKGGRNQEFALASAIAIDGLKGLSLFSAGTDGTDGPTDAAGAMVDGSTCEKARKMDLDPGRFLAVNDSYAFFESLGDLIQTGPTRTNVMDIICMLVNKG